jgi:hypothetical protein
VGSAALDDWLPRRSDLDVLVLTDSEPAEDDLDILEDLHDHLTRDSDLPHVDAMYVTVGGNGAMPNEGGYPHVVDGVFRREGYEPDPVLWATLCSHGVTMRGPEIKTLRVRPDPADLRSWNRQNLESYWRPLAADVRAQLRHREPDSFASPLAVVWMALGPGRLHCTIVTGEIISKTAAADYSAQRFPEYAELLDRAKRWRHGEDAATFTVTDARRVVDLIEMIIKDAQRPSEATLR